MPPAICDGDSGSWVVSLDNNQLLGHVVASDILGDVYVIPLGATLSDIRSRVGALSIGLPSALGNADISGTGQRGGESLREEEAVTGSNSMRAMSPHTDTGLITKVRKSYRLGRLLYRRARTNAFISMLPDTSAGIMSLTNVLSHLQSEVEDPDSLLNSHVERARSYSRQLSIALDECLHTMDRINMILDRLETLPVTINNSMEPPGDKGQEAPFSSISTTLLQEVTEEVGNKLSAQKTNIDILLDAVQLDYYNGVTDQTLALPQSDLDVIIDKVDKVAIRMWRQKRLGKALTGETANDDEKETPWLEFRKELVKEGFSEEVLNQRKVGKYPSQFKGCAYHDVIRMFSGPTFGSLKWADGVLRSILSL